jgi:hypothetical protein
MKDLHLFTPVTERLPENNERIYFIIESKIDHNLSEHFGVFVEVDSFGRDNMFISSDGGFHTLISLNFKVTHWLDLSALTTKERANQAMVNVSEKLIDSVGNFNSHEAFEENLEKILDTEYKNL